MIEAMRIVRVEYLDFRTRKPVLVGDHVIGRITFDGCEVDGGTVHYVDAVAYSVNEARVRLARALRGIRSRLAINPTPIL